MNAHNWINDGIWHTILPCFSLNRYSQVLGYWLWNLPFLICRIKNAPHSGFPGGSVIKNRPEMWGPRFDPWVRKIPWRRAWQPTLVLLPRESHGQRSLAACNPMHYSPPSFSVHGILQARMLEWVAMPSWFSNQIWQVWILLNHLRLCDLEPVT